MELERDVLKTWAWTALNEETGLQYGRFRTEAEATDEANRRTGATQNVHRARKAMITPGERVASEARCDRCQERRPGDDGLVIPMGEEFLCRKCSVGEQAVSLHSTVRLKS